MIRRGDARGPEVTWRRDARGRDTATSAVGFASRPRLSGLKLDTLEARPHPIPRKQDPVRSPLSQTDKNLTDFHCCGSVNTEKPRIRAAIVPY